MPLLNRTNYRSNSSANPPSYALSDVRIGVLHMGLGAFHRAHQAVFFEHALRGGNMNYGVCGITQRTSDIAESLNAQDCLYTVNARDGAGNQPMIVGAIREATFYPRDVARLLEIAKSPDLRLMTITVSEKAYRPDSDSTLCVPRRIATLLAARFEAGLPGIAVISCDNLPSNGAVTRMVVTNAIKSQGRNDGFLDWVEEQIRFPNSMVDRIVPAITKENIDEFEKAYGYRDLSLITTEPYNEWVIDQDPLSEELGPVGVRFVSHVEPYEMTKIRIFNGTHSTLAYLCQLSGIEYVAQGIVDPTLAPFITRLQEEELSRSFTPPYDLDPIEYACTIRKRISNPTLLHRSAQIAMDGSQKLPQRLFTPANDLLAAGLPTTRITLAIAAWLHYLATNAAVSDPLAPQLQPIARNRDAAAAVEQTLRAEQLVTRVDSALLPAITKWLEKLRCQPVHEILLELERGSI